MARHTRKPDVRSQALARELRDAIRLLARRGLRHPAGKPAWDSLPGQPFDSLLLASSPLFRRSRSLFLKQRGSFAASLLSSARSLSGAILLENRITYSPVAEELIWSAHDPRENPERLLELRTWTTSLFHEQNHRLLWNFLPASPTDRESIRRTLHLCESLVVVADMMLSDSLEPRLARALYLVGALYDPGTPVRRSLRSDSRYRRYLLAAFYATFLNLELYSAAEVSSIVHAIFGREAWVERAARRALALDRLFVERTNPIWQSRNAKSTRAFFQERLKASTTFERLELSEDPFQHGMALLWAEKWLDFLTGGN